MVNINMHTPPTLSELLDAKEGASDGTSVQFKEAKNTFNFDEAVICCCALSNCGGGLLVFGITDKRPRKVVGSHAFEQPERTRERLIGKLNISVDFYLYTENDKRVLVFEVAEHPLGIPVTVDGIAWWYKGDSLISMPEQVRRRIYEEVGIDFSASICKGAGIVDLEHSAIEIFRKKCVEKSGNQNLLTLSDLQLLSDCGAVVDDSITYAALILFGTHKALGKYLAQSEVVFEYRLSDEPGPAAQREEFRDGFFSFYNKLWDLINLRNDKQHYQDGFFVFDIPTFNERVVREAILNAVCHRIYQSQGSVFVRQYPGKIEIESPGGLPYGITTDNILHRQYPRNRRIAEILSLCGLVERSGQGMDLIYRLSIREAKRLPDFTGTDDYWVKLTLNGANIDQRMLDVMSHIGDEQMKTFSTDDFLIMHALYFNQDISDNLRPNLNRLVDIGVVEHIGKNRYVLARRLYMAVGEAGVHTRKSGLDRDTNKELLVKHIRESGEDGAPLRDLMQVLPALSRGQVQTLLNGLRVEGRVCVKGKANAARWIYLSQSD